MKKMSLTLSLVIILALLLQGIAFAALPGTGWQTSYAAMNVGTSAGSFGMVAYDKDSTTTYSSDQFSVDPKETLRYIAGANPTYPTGDIIGFTSELPSGFEGSVVLSSNVPLTSAATLTNSSVLGGTAISRYQAVGSDAVALEILFPGVKHNYFNQTTTFYVQAAGADANVTFTYSMNDGSTHTQSQVIPANRMFVFDPANATPPVASTLCGDNANTSPCFGAASVVSTTGEIAGVVVESPHTGSPAPFALSTRGLTSSDIATTIFAPTIKNYYYDATAGFTVMNTGSASANAQITLTVTGVQPGTDAATAGVVVGDTFTDSEIIVAGSSVVFGPFNNNLGGMPRGIFASAEVTSVDDVTYDPQLLAGVSNEAKNSALIAGGKAKATYYGYAPINATDTLSCPIVSELTNGQTGGMAVVNVGNLATTVHFEYIVYNGPTYHFWTTNPLDPGVAIGTNRVSTNPNGKFTNDGTWSFSEMAGKKFSVYIYTSNGEEIVALAQEAAIDFSNDIRNYECVNIVAP